MLNNELVVTRLSDLAHIDEAQIFKNTGIGMVKKRVGKIAIEAEI